MKSKILSLLVLLLTAASGAWADEATITLKCGTTEKTYENVTLPWSTTAEILNAVVTDIDFNININAISGGDGKVVKYGNENFTVTGTFSGEATVVVSYNIGSSATITVTAPGSAPEVEVTTNAASEGATFTEASFQMPAFDATAEYELVRDMSIQMTTQVGDGKDGFRIRIKKNAQSGKYEPAEMEFQDMLALFSVTDQIEEKSLVCYGQGAVCQLKVYAVDDNDQPTGDPILFANLEPGRYIVKAQAVDDSNYDGETALSNIFVLFQGFEVAVPAKEFATYYKNEAVYADPETSSNAELYTIANVNGDQAVLSSAIDAVPSNTPLIIYNNSDQDKVFLLIPCNEPDLALNVYNGFIGTLVSTTIAASTASQTNYALNGKQFVFVKDAISIGANKCWLSVENVSNAPARAISIVFEEGTTGLEAIDNGQLTIDNEGWYDLSGRKLKGEPTTKGVFIKNGKKVMR